MTADDFVQTWQSVLTPAFPAPNAYQLYVIKGAKEAKEGRASPESIGVKALNPSTLVVELEQPAPYFLEMTSCHFFFPASPAMRQAAVSTEFDKVVGNGPFMQDRWKRRSEFSVVKNPHYWDAPQVNLERVTLVTLDENTALQLYNAGSLDWAGSPLSTMPQDAVATLKNSGKLQVASGAGTHWFRLNTEKAPFNNEKMRQAFALALNRKAIVEHVTQGNQQPAIGIIPPAFGFSHQDYFADNDVSTAQKLFNEALEENQLTKATMPSISLRYAANDRNHKIAQAVQQQWSKAFDIPVALDSSEPQVLLDRLRSGDYQISMGSWYADIRDPINFLEIFKSKTNPTNQTFWESPQYTTLLDQSSLELDPAERTLLLEQAEKVLIEGMPVIPLFHSAYNYMKNDHVTGEYFSPLGYLEFKEASKTP